MVQRLLLSFVVAAGLMAADDRPAPCSPAPDCLRVTEKLRERLSLPPGMRETGEISEDDAVAIALRNNAGFRAALAALGVARADLIEAGLLRNLSLQLLFPVGPKPFESLLSAPVEAIWQRPRRVAAAKTSLQQVSEALVQGGLDLARDVRVAYAGLQRAEAHVEATSRAAELREKIAALTERRLAHGDISEMEATPARIDARSMRDLAQRAPQDRDAARDRLRLLLGLQKDSSPLRLVPAPDPAAVAPPDWPQLLETAMASRPDLRAAELAVEAAALRAKWEQSRIIPMVTALLSIKDVGSAGVRAGPGVQAELPVFNRNQGGIARADAEVRQAALRYAALRDQVELEVRQARTHYVQALESLERVRHQLVPAVRESMSLAEKAYNDGDVSYLFVLEASRQMYDAEIREQDEAAALRRTAAELARAVGRKL